MLRGKGNFQGIRRKEKKRRAEVEFLVPVLLSLLQPKQIFSFSFFSFLLLTNFKGERGSVQIGCRHLF